ncbi:MarR family transcriptional regulator [Pseudolysinimonas sp.]|uniref:MarR family winged helix-turn-helix transcriptional regulator n=1 Tax=Pseudolysinimonas sp. TaxID=2680009 RepID=UPI00286A6B1E|nr:MarR family transcriptional regulator [Pseudolysinimonas sp.]
MTISNEIIRIEAALAQIRRGQQSGRLGRTAGADAATGALFRALDALEFDPLSVTELALRVGVDQPRASRLAAGAVSRGLAVRLPDAADSRRSLLRLTPAGREFIARAHATRRDAVSTALAGFDADEASTFASLLERFLAAWPH